MLRVHLVGTTAAALIASAFAVPAQAPQPAPPPFATTKVTDNVYIFRYGGHQSMFIVTPAGVIATDPISERRPAKPYIDAIQAVKGADQNVIYSHSHFISSQAASRSRILGDLCRPKNAKAIAALKPDDVVIPTRLSMLRETSRSAARRSSSITSARTTRTTPW
jgi:hypothetical protein